MKCPFCGSDELRTLETRDSTNNMNRRRKECLVCGKRMTTYEYIEEIEDLLSEISKGSNGDQEIISEEEMRILLTNNEEEQ